MARSRSWAAAPSSGIGVVAGKRCIISASDSAVKGGTVAPMGLKKGLRVQQIAQENKLPLISLVESGGANLMYQSEIFIEGGRTFANQARMSAHGPCRRLPWCTAPAQRVAPICRAFRTM
jgi:acetyl-CoA carboxylase carboxyltransferase component